MTTKVTSVIGPLIHAVVREIEKTRKDRWEKHLDTCEICKATDRERRLLPRSKGEKIAQT